MNASDLTFGVEIETIAPDSAIQNEGLRIGPYIYTDPSSSVLAGIRLDPTVGREQTDRLTQRAGNRNLCLNAGASFQVNQA